MNILDNSISGPWKLTDDCRMEHIGCTYIYVDILDNSISAVWELTGSLSNDHISAVCIFM
jgi:hypothetical protein